MAHQNSSIEVNTIEPQSGTTLTIGNSGQDVVVNADSIKNNVLKDAGGNALFTSNGSGVLSGLNAGFGSAQVLISTTTVSTAVATIDFTSGIDSTYNEYVFKFINIDPVTNSVTFGFQANATDSTSYDETITSTAFRARHYEDGTSGAVNYEVDADQAQGTALQPLLLHLGGGGDKSASGELHLFNPSSTTYVKNFYSESNHYGGAGEQTQNYFIAGYINTTTAIDDIQFKMSSGNINAGIIKMYGIK